MYTCRGRKQLLKTKVERLFVIDTSYKLLAIHAHELIKNVQHVHYNKSYYYCSIPRHYQIKRSHMISQSLTPHCYYIVVLHYGSDICQVKLLFYYKVSGCQPQCLFQDSNIGGELANLKGEILYLRYDLLQNLRIWGVHYLTALK